MTWFLSKATTFCAIIATMNLLLMAAIANDGSVGNSSFSSTTVSEEGVTTRKTTSPPTGSYLVQGKSYESFKGSKDRSTSTAENSSISSSLNLMDSPTSPFLTENSTELTAQIGSNALIPCVVRNSGDGVTVSWIRRKDYHLLTVGLQLYSSDDRFQAIHAQSPEVWTLKIKYVQPRDAGVYECQVSTHPPSSIFVKLNVVEARAEIAGGPDKYIKTGSSLRLICELKQSTEEPAYIFWYQGLQMINYDPIRQIEVTHDRYTSTLVLHNVQKSDSGNYSCVPSNSIPASIFVHIINVPQFVDFNNITHHHQVDDDEALFPLPTSREDEEVGAWHGKKIGENQAAMQHGSHSTSCVPCPPLWFLSFLLSITLQTVYFQFLTHSSVMSPKRRPVPWKKWSTPTTQLQSHLPALTR